KRNYRTKIEKQTVNKQSYYKILVGPYSTRSKAQAAKDKLEREEQDSFLIILK
ncbi:MAG: SPOR domain-containing protein, partial [candidate division Zixibacteria bacterium]|nr:SPOR domain-containing protein [candidate division Zixibacteria bacterium]